MSNRGGSLYVGDAYPVGGPGASRGLSKSVHIPFNGVPVSIGPFPFIVRSVTLINQTGGILTVTDDRGEVFTANADTSTTFSIADTIQLSAVVAPAQPSTGKLVVIAYDFPQATNSSQLAALGNPVANINGITGRVNSAGAILGGSGFTCVRNALGDYTVTFAAAFAGVPVVTVEINSGGAFAETTVVAVAGSFNLLIFSPSGGVQVDRAFNFIAIEVQ